VAVVVVGGRVVLEGSAVVPVVENPAPHSANPTIVA